MRMKYRKRGIGEYSDLFPYYNKDKIVSRINYPLYGESFDFLNKKGFLSSLPCHKNFSSLTWQSFAITWAKNQVRGFTNYFSSLNKKNGFWFLVDKKSLSSLFKLGGSYVTYLPLNYERPTASFSAFPGLNTGIVLAFIFIFAPVWGFLPFLAILFLAPKVPKPTGLDLVFSWVFW